MSNQLSGQLGNVGNQTTGRFDIRENIFFAQPVGGIVVANAFPPPLPNLLIMAWTPLDNLSNELSMVRGCQVEKLKGWAYAR